jgi:hypothetical protein
VVEDVKRVGAPDRHLERLLLPQVGHEDGEGVVAPSPEQRHDDTAASTNCELLERLG